jgi:NitT/TauT family transport system permease protein
MRGGAGTAWAGLAAFVAAAVAGVLLVPAFAPVDALDPGFWAFVLALTALGWWVMGRLSALGGWAAAYLVPVVFGFGLLVGWELITVGLGIPPVLLPPPSLIGAEMAQHVSTLAADFHQTVIRSVIPGYLIGCGAGFLVAVAIDRSPFLQRGLLPIGSLVSALPIVGIAPIMVMWFGFDWQSKAAVVTVMTFFPMLVNTVAGLTAAGSMERDLMRSYGASYLQTLLKLRLPAAMPFVFNALKINSTLALIGAIVAEFFGTPIVGMGFRISAEVGRMNIDLVWGTIVVAGITGSAFYGLLALAERAATFWHPSFRR